jgi:glycosyltransferase involved in cell wall biosynthesis
VRVLFFSHQADFVYGGEIVTLEFMRALKAKGVDVHFASPAGPYHELAERTGVRCHTISSIEFNRNFAQLPFFAGAYLKTHRGLAKILTDEKIELLHATSLKSMVYAWALGKKRPVLWHHHDILPAGFANSLWLKALASRAEKILAPSEATRRALVEAGVGDTKVKVLRNGFCLSDWKPRPPRKEGDLFRIGFVGELSHRKGADRLEKILPAIQDIPNTETWVIGEGLSEPEFAFQLRAKLENQKVKFLGRRSDMKEIYQQLDLLLVPSRQDPLPTVIVEAGLSGLPVVGANVGGIPEMIVNGENGFLFDTERDAAEAIRQTKTKWQPLARAARALAESRYDSARLSEQLQGIYQEAMHAFRS